MIARVCLFTVFLLLSTSQLYAGAMVAAEFKDQRAQTPEVLAHVPLKAVVAEFLDPGDSGLGKSLGYLIWRELLTAISDQAGAGVVLAESPPGERLVDMVQRDYHQAAERIGRQQRARMMIWGAAEEESGATLTEIYLSLLTESADSGLRLRLSSKIVAGPPELSRSSEPAIEVDISDKRFNFTPLSLTREKLFDRTLISAARVKVYQSPDESSAVLLTLPADQTIQATDMVGAWFKVKLPEARQGFINAGNFSNLRLAPRTVIGKGDSVNLRTGPGTDHRAVGKHKLEGSFRVLDMRYRPQHGLWYRIDLGSNESWVAGWLVQPQFSFPAIHFVAGLYRYYGERYQQAIEAFEQFIALSDPASDNVNLAIAYQLLGASRLLSASASSGEKARSYQDFSNAVALTPFNPNAYLLRSLVALSTQRPTEALLDLEHALRLNANFKPARQMAAAAEAIANQRGFSPLGEITGLASQEQKLQSLLERYRIESISDQR